MAGCGEVARKAASRRGPTLRGLRAGAGASDDRTRAGAPACAALPPVPPRGHAATADGARRSRAGRNEQPGERRWSDRAAGECAFGRCPVSAVVQIASARPEGRARRGRRRLRAIRPIAVSVGKYSMEVIGMVNLDMSADVDQRKGSRGRTTRSETLCRRCGKREALCSRYTRKQRVNRRRRHDLCFQCRRALRDATRNPML